MPDSAKPIVGGKPVVTYVPAQLSAKQEWFIYYYALDPATGRLRRKRQKVNRVKNLRERRRYAYELIDRINAALRDGWSPFAPEQSQNVTISLTDAMDQFLRDRIRTVEMDTARTYTSHVKMLGEWLHAEGLSRIRAHQFGKAHAQRYMNYNLDVKKVRPNTYNNYITVCRIIFEWLLDREFIGVNPFGNLRKLKSSEKNRDVIPLDVRREILEHFRKHQPGMVLTCYLLFYTEIRPTEQCKLRVKDVDLDAQLIRMPGAITKTGKGRNPTIPDVFLEYLKSLPWQTYDPDHYLVSIGFLPGPKKLNPRYISKAWTAMRERLKLPMKYKFYSLRDTGIDHMLVSGVKAIHVSRQSGHTNLEMTSLYANHISPVANEDIKTLKSGF